MERQHKYKVNQHIALNELVESPASSTRGGSVWSYDSDWDYYDSLQTDKISYEFTVENKNELSVAHLTRLEYNVRKLNENIDNIDTEMLVNKLPLF